MIDAVIERHRGLLEAEGWPTSAEEVFSLICLHDVDHDDHEALYHFICELFNSWCLWCEPDHIMRDDGECLSVNPYDPELDAESSPASAQKTV